MESVIRLRDTEIKIFTGIQIFLAENICKEIGIKLESKNFLSDGEAHFIYDMARM